MENGWQHKVEVLGKFMNEQFEQLVKLIESRVDFETMKESMSKCIQEEILIIENKSEKYQMKDKINKLKFSGDHKPQSKRPEIETKKLRKISTENKNNNVWNLEPKHWKKYNTMCWNNEILKDRNKPKGCLHKCGLKNNKGMMKCDKCVYATEQDIMYEFICIICSSRDVTKTDKWYKLHMIYGNLNITTILILV